MINATDTEAMQPADIEALEVGAEFCRRRRKGLPPDRWATTEDMHKVARALEMALAGWAGEAKARYDAQLASMRMDGED